MREDRNFKASDVSGPSIWIFILCLRDTACTFCGLILYKIQNGGTSKYLNNSIIQTLQASTTVITGEIDLDVMIFEQESDNESNSEF
jgi:hypothetical protein